MNLELTGAKFQLQLIKRFCVKLWKKPRTSIKKKEANNILEM